MTGTQSLSVAAQPACDDAQMLLFLERYIELCCRMSHTSPSFQRPQFFGLRRNQLWSSRTTMKCWQVKKYVMVSPNVWNHSSRVGGRRESARSSTFGTRPFQISDKGEHYAPSEWNGPWPSSCRLEHHFIIPVILRTRRMAGFLTAPAVPESIHRMSMIRRSHDPTKPCGHDSLIRESIAATIPRSTDPIWPR
jgi:hypothetical protein